MSECASCLIISSNCVVTPYPVYPLGAAYIAGALTHHGHTARHFDMLADGGEAGLLQCLQEKNYDLIGISIRNLDTVDSADPRVYFDDTLQLVEFVRKNSDAMLVLGGPAFSIMPETIMETTRADYGVVGEGEAVVSWLASELAAGRKPSKKIHISDPDEGGWRPSEISPSTAKYYTDHGGMLNVQTKRGCPHKCTYCSYPTIEGKTLRYRDPGEVVDEIMRLQKDCGAKYLFFADSTFNDPQSKHLELAEEMIRRGSTIPWCAFFRPHNIMPDELKLMKRAGLASMELGTDAASDKTLAGLKKNFLFEDVLKVHKRIVAEEIPCAHFIMFGGPEEDDESLRQGLKNIEQFDNSVVFGFIGIRVFPGTAIYERAIADGLVQVDQTLLMPEFYYSPKIDRETIEEKLRSSFGDRLDRIYPCHEFNDRIALLHKMGQVGPLWDLILRKGRR